MGWHWTFIAQAVLPLAVSRCAVSTECSQYLTTSVSEMRRAKGSGCFEVQHAVVIARTPSATVPRVYVQDQGGGPYSAIRAKCDSSPTHACTQEAAQEVQTLLDGSLVTLRGYYLQGSVSGFEEIYLDDAIDEQTLAPVPPPQSVDINQLGQAARTPEAWFQVVTADITAQDPLVMYDFSPHEFAHAGPCPNWSGFSVIRASAIPTLSVAACRGSANPAGLMNPDPREILIGREFFKEFFASTDCACAAQSKQHLLTPASTLVGTIRGVLTPEISAGSSRLYQVFHPLSRSAFPMLGG